MSIIELDELIMEAYAEKDRRKSNECYEIYKQVYSLLERLFEIGGDIVFNFNDENISFKNNDISIEFCNTKIFFED